MADFGRQLADLLYGQSQQPQEPQRQKIARLLESDRLRRLAGIGEAAATIGTGLVGSVPAGLAGLSQLIPTRGRTPDVNKAAQTVEDVQGAMTYMPRTETGQRVLQKAAGPLEMLGAPAEYLGEKTLQYTGSPAAATAANVILDPVNFIGMPGSGKAVKAAGRAAMAAPGVAGDFLSDALTPASRFKSQRGAVSLSERAPKAKTSAASEPSVPKDSQSSKTAYERSLAQGFEHGWYHGTTGDIRSFDPSRLGEATGAASAKKGFFFVRDPISPPEQMLKKSDDPKSIEMLQKLGIPEEEIEKLNTVSFAGNAAETASGYSSIGGSRTYRDAMKKANQAEKRGDWDEYHRQMQIAEDSEMSRMNEAQELVAKYGERRDEMTDAIQKALYDRVLPQKEAEMLDKWYKEHMPYGWYNLYSPEQFKNLKKSLVSKIGEEKAAPAIEAMNLFESTKAERNLAERSQEGANVMPVALRYKNPYVYDFKGSTYRDQTYSDLVDQAILGGHDALILRNTYDPGGGPAKLVDIGVVFDPAQIRSTFARFDPKEVKSTDITKKKGGSVRISDNPDTMRLELAGGGAVGQERSIGSKLVGGGARGAGMRAIFGMDLPEDATPFERDVYANVTAMSNTPGPWALAAAPAALVKGAKGAKAVKEIPAPLPRAAPKTKAEIEAIAERMAPQMLGEYVRKEPGSAVTVAGKTKKQFEREKELPVQLTGEAKTPEAVDIERLKGKAMMGILGDPSITGRELESVGDIRLGLRSPQHGGPLYGMGREDESFWASGKGAAQKVQNLAEEVSKQYGTDVLGKYIMMGPEGLNYAQHFADANLQAIDLSKMTKRQIEGFNSLMRKGSPASGPRPSFTGIQDKEGAYLEMAFDPELRKHFNALMQMNTVTEKFNLPSGNDIRFAITEPLLRDLERGVTGMSIGQMKPGAALTLSEHPTYEMNIPGKFMGSSKYPVPYELMFPDTVKAIRENPRQAPHEFGSLGMVGPRQIIDQQMIDEIKAYEENIKKLIGKKKGGAVKMQAGGAIKAAAKAVKPTAEQAARLAALREKMVPRGELSKKIMEENLDKPLSEIEEGGLTKALEALPKKKGGRVKFTDNLDTMRLAVQKRK